MTNHNGGGNLQRLLNKCDGASDKRIVNKMRKACTEGNVRVVKLLLEYGVECTLHNNYPMRIATKNGHCNVVKLLLEYGAK